MGLPNLLYPPAGESGWREFWFDHFQDHIDIVSKLQTLLGIEMVTYVIDPWYEGDKTGILERHQQYHNDMNGLLGIAGTDLSELDIKREDAVQEWLEINFREHSDVHQALAI